MFTMLVSVGVGTLAATTLYYIYRAHKRDQLEEKQLNAFIEQLVYCPDCAEWVVGERQRIKNMKKCQ